VKCLGVILDAKLTSKKHVKQKTNKAYSSFWLCHQSLVKTWGLKPKVVHWLYTDRVRPMLMYTAIVCWLKVGLAMVMAADTGPCITGSERMAPTTALEVLFGLHTPTPILYLVAEANASASAYRLRGKGQWYGRGSDAGHAQILTRRMESDSVFPVESGKNYTNDSLWDSLQSGDPITGTLVIKRGLWLLSLKG
jgi:hypothetical protein